MSTYLVTGGAGFIGTNLVEHLLSRHDVTKVRVLDNLSSGYRDNVEAFDEDPRYEFIEGDIRDLATCRAAVEGVDYVAHFAALGSVPRSLRDPITSNEVNVGGTLNVLLAVRDARHVRRLIYAASSSTYGDSAELPKVEGREGHPLSPYGVTKAAIEQYAAVFSSTFGLHSIGLRFFNVFGPRQRPDNPYAAAIPLFCDAFVRRSPPTVYGDGSTSRDFTYVDNAVHASMLALLTDEVREHRIYNVACGKAFTLNDIIDTLRRLSGINLQAEYGPERIGDVKHSLASIERISRELAYRPQVHFEEGLRRTWDWIQTRPSVAS